MTHEETTRNHCSPATEVSAEPLRCKHGSAAMHAFVSVSNNTGACPSFGNPICRPKVMAPPFPPHPLPFTVSKTNTHAQLHLRIAHTNTHWSRLCKCTRQWQRLCPGTYLTMLTQHPTISAGGHRKQMRTSGVDRENYSLPILAMHRLTLQTSGLINNEST